MEITGTIKQVIDPITGTSSNGEWKKQHFIIETEGDYPKSVCIEVWNDKITIPVVGSKVNVSINVESREYNSKFYTDVKAWKLDILNAAEVVHKDIPPASEEPVTDAPPF